jgi:2-polyprenyl-3-methyl-5-hydroxy-6-metoxy-1,4-benzoquinol methylase
VIYLNDLEKIVVQENFFINQKKDSTKSSDNNSFIEKYKRKKILPFKEFNSEHLDINEYISRERSNPLKSDILSFIEYLGVMFHCKYLIAVGCNQINLLQKLSDKFLIIGIDDKQNIERAKKSGVSVHWVEYDLETAKILPIGHQMLKQSMIISLNNIEYLENPHNLLFSIKKAMKHSPICLITTPDRELQIEQSTHSFTLSRPKREWNMSEFQKLLNHFQFNTEFVGLTKINESAYKKDQILSIIGNESVKKEFDDNFKVVALMAVYNEEDIIYHSIKKLMEQKVYVYIIDNWSTDNTFGILKHLKNNPYFLGCERFPYHHPNKNDNKFNFAQILKRKEELANSLDANWFIHCDADEIRESPWKELNLKEAIQYVDQMGYNAIDHTVINFQPINNSFTSGDFENHFKYFEFGIYRGGFIKTWKKTDRWINLSNSGGHDAQFYNRKVAPFKFLVKHYPLRSQKHAEKKIFMERKPRYMKELKARGWHIQYDGYKQGNSFLRNPNELLPFSKDNFLSYFLVERLSNLYKFL